jgi:Domain of Unknown Function with PDB structure (DUF3857)/Transglutaminase-like superfamily
LKKTIFNLFVYFLVWMGALNLAYAEAIDLPVVQEKMRRHIEVDAKGRYTETVERTSRVMNEYGADRIGRHTFSHKTSKETLRVTDAKVIQPDGKVLHLEKDWVKHSRSGENDGRSFGDEHSTVVVFPQVMVGSRLYSKYVLQRLKAEKPGEFAIKLNLPPHMVYEDSQTTLRAPKSLKLLVNHRGLEGGIIHETARHVTYQFRIKQLVAHKPEDDAVDYEDFAPYLIFTQAPDYLEIGRQYLRASRSKVRITPEIRKLAMQLTGDASSEIDKAKILYDWVSRNIRYISTTVGDGGFVPRDSAYIFSRRFGDCKDHAVLLEAMLRAVGIESTAALINLGEAFELNPGPAANSPINHVITYIPSLDLYLDSTAQIVPFGKLDEDVLDKPTVLVALNRYGRTPKMQAAENTEVARTELVLNADGEIEGTTNATMSGTLEINRRFAYFAGLTNRMDTTINELLLRFNEIGRGHLEVTASSKTDLPYRWDAQFSLEPIADLKRSGAFMIPVGATPGYIAEKTLHKPLDKREFPFVCESVTAEDYVTLKLPETIMVESIPADVTHQSTHVTYTARYQKVDDTLRVERKLVFDYPSRKCPPAYHSEVVEASRVIRADFKSAVVYRAK